MKILIAEDNAEIAALIRLFLEKEGYEVIVILACYTCRQAEGKFCLIFYFQRTAHTSM